MGLFKKKLASSGPPPVVGSGPTGSGCHLGQTIAIVGKVTSQDPVVFSGQLNGEISVHNRLAVGHPARIEGIVSAESLTAAGQIKGQVTVAGSLHMEPSAAISGRVETAQLSVVQGAMLNGELKMSSRQREEPDP
jgi:cytoskeletal protein CcmA (bactofilin family)